MAEFKSLERSKTNLVPPAQFCDGQDVEAGAEGEMSGSLPVAKTPPSPPSTPVSDYNAAGPIPESTAQDESDWPAKKGMEEEEKAQYTNEMLGIIKNTLAEHGINVIDWDLPSLANFLDAWKRARNAYQRYYNVRRPGGERCSLEAGRGDQRKGSHCPVRYVL
ncbi:MAG: hypothetical protein LQ349_003161 [Xanthoria aureola]|nr:MAG: hypothetical protein LQ349_003161 [Xanthoria aureola]